MPPCTTKPYRREINRGAGDFLTLQCRLVPAVAAVIGVILYFVGAVISHLRQYDLQVASPTIVLVWGVAALVLRALSHGDHDGRLSRGGRRGSPDCVGA